MSTKPDFSALLKHCFEEVNTRNFDCIPETMAKGGKPTGTKENSTGNTTGKKENSHLRCFNCGTLGHTTFNCPKPKQLTKSFYNCQSTEHLIANRPKPRIIFSM